MILLLGYRRMEERTMKKSKFIVFILASFLPLLIFSVKPVSASSFTVPTRFCGTWYNEAGTAAQGVKLQRNRSHFKITRHSIMGMANLNFHQHRKNAFSINTGINFDSEHFHLYKLKGHDALITTQGIDITLYRKSKKLAKKYKNTDRKYAWC